MAGAAAGVCHAGWCSGDVASGSAGAGGRAGVSDRRTERVGPGRSTVTSRTDRVERGLARLGWIVGRNLQSEDRFAAGDERRIRDFAEEIVGRMPDAILARGTQATEGLKQQTSTVPIVFVPVSDPVASGFVNKLRAARRPRTAPFRIPACLLPGSRRTAGCSPRKPPLPSVAEHDRNAALRTTAR